MCRMGLKYWFSPELLNEIKTIASSKTAEHRLVVRALIILAYSKTLSIKKAAEQAGVERRTASKWVRRLAADPRVEALRDKERKGSPKKFSEVVAAAITEAACSIPQQQGLPRGLWTLELLADFAKANGWVDDVSTSTVWRMLAEAHLKPWKNEYWMKSKDPDFEAKADRVIGLYLFPPPDSAVVCVDEKTGTAVRTPVAPVLLPLPGVTRRTDPDYHRHGTFCFHAALDVHSGYALGSLTERNRAVEYVDFLGEIALVYETSKEVYIIRDNSRIHGTEAVRNWFAAHPNFVEVPTPVHASWLNLAESYLHCVSSQCLRGAVFEPSPGVTGKDAVTADVRDQFESHVYAYVNQYNQTARPYRWGRVRARPRRMAMLGRASRTATGLRYLRGRPVEVLAS